MVPTIGTLGPVLLAPVSLVVVCVGGLEIDRSCGGSGGGVGVGTGTGTGVGVGVGVGGGVGIGFGG